MRKRLDDLNLADGQRWMVFFPGGKPSRVLIATGQYDYDKKAHVMKDAITGQAEWVEGWLVARPAKR